MNQDDAKCVVNALVSSLNRRDETSLRNLMSATAFPDERSLLLQMESTKGEVSPVTIDAQYGCMAGKDPCATAKVIFQASTTAGTQRWTRYYTILSRDGDLILDR